MMNEKGPVEGGGAAGNRTARYAEIVRRKFPNVTVDFVAIENEEEVCPSYSLIADVVFDCMKMRRQEINGFQTFREEKGKFTIKIKSAQDIDVNTRFKDSSEFRLVDNEGMNWRISIRGVRREEERKEVTWKLRIFNPPQEASFGEVKEEVEKIAVVRSGIREEVVTEEEEPRLSGIPTGVLNVRIKPTGRRIPGFITVRRIKVRIRLILPSNVCIRCFSEGHRASECCEDRWKSDVKEEAGRGSMEDQNEAKKPGKMDHESMEEDDDIRRSTEGNSIAEDSISGKRKDREESDVVAVEKESKVEGKGERHKLKNEKSQGGAKVVRAGL